MKKVKICSDIKHPPFEFINKDGEVDGFSIDITRAIAKAAGINLEIELLDWTEAIKGVESGKYDGIQGMSIIGTRPEKYIFGAEYLTVFHSAFALTKRKDIKTLINIDQYRVAVQENDAGYEIVTRMSCNKNPISTMVLSSQEDALKLLLLEKVDLVIGNKQTILYYAEQLGIEKDIKLIGNPLNLTKYGLAFKKENYDIANKFNMGMNIIKKNGIYEQIYDKWFVQKMGYFGKQIIDNVETGVIYIDKLGRVTAVNNFAKKILNLPINNILFKSFYETEISSIFNTNIIQRILDKEQDAYFAKIEVDQEGIRTYLEVNYTKLLDNQHNLIGVLINFTDMTEQKRIEETLIRKDKMESLGFLLLNVAHELRNPITSIKNFIELIPKHLDDEEFRESLLYHVPKQIEYVDKLVSNLLEYSRPKEPNITTIYIKELLEKGLLQSIYKGTDQEKNIKFEVHIPEDFTIQGDSDQIKQVVINLIVNAIDSIKEDGIIKIYIKEERDKKMIIIEDSGELIQESIAQKIFDPFFTTKTQGTGLGLFISYHLIRENGGIIEISNIEEGTRVSLIFDKN